MLYRTRIAVLIQKSYHAWRSNILDVFAFDMFIDINAY